MSKFRACLTLVLLFATYFAPSFAHAQVTRLQESDPAISYLQNRWYAIPDPRWTDGQALGAFEAGSTMTVNFSGTGITWIGYRCACAAGTARLYMDGQFLGTVNTYAAQPQPQAEIYHIDGLAAGQHSFTIEATGTYHIDGTSAYILVDAFDIEGSGAQSGDTVPPEVSITSPPDGASASGVVWFSMDASDNVWVQDVRVMVNGVQLGVTDTAAPYSIGVDTASLADGTYEFTAVATDWAGNTAQDMVTVQIGNSGYIEEFDPAVSYAGAWYDLNHPTASGGSIVGAFQRGATATVNFNGTGIAWIGYRCTCAAGIARVYVDDSLVGTVDTYAPTPEPRAEVFSTAGLPAGEHVLKIEHTGNYNRDGDSAYLLIDAFRITNGGSSSGGGEDTTPPSVGVTAPTGTVQGVVTVSANAQDDTGVAGVQFILDGEALGAEDLTAPYSISWDTTTAAEGGHVLWARARDEAGNTFEMPYPQSVNVDNTPASETTPPTVSFDSPAFGTTVTSGSAAFTATAADNVGVARVAFTVEGLLVSQDTTAPYTATWSTQDLADGGYVARATAYDHDGNRIVSMAHLLNVWNSAAPPPTGEITAPADGATVSGTITLTAEASHPSGVARAGFVYQLENGSSGSGIGGGASDVSAPYTATWDTTTVPNGTYRVWVDVHGNDESFVYGSLIHVVVDN